MRIFNWFKDTPDNYIRKDLTLGIEKVPPGAVICFRSRGGLIGWTIRKIEKDKFDTCGWSNHTEIYFGSGKHETVGAQADGVKPRKLDACMNTEHQFVIFVKTNLMVSQLSILKAYAYGSVGREYDFAGVASFVSRLFKSNPYKNFCDENVIECYHQAGIKLSNKEASKSTPQDVMDYLSSTEGLMAGWIKFDTYNV